MANHMIVRTMIFGYDDDAQGDGHALSMSKSLIMTLKMTLLVPMMTGVMIVTMLMVVCIEIVH